MLLNDLPETVRAIVQQHENGDLHALRVTALNLVRELAGALIDRALLDEEARAARRQESSR